LQAALFLCPLQSLLLLLLLLLLLSLHVQRLEGVIIAQSGSGSNTTVTVRRVFQVGQG
jgi:hypothetical protein